MCYEQTQYPHPLAQVMLAEMYRRAMSVRDVVIAMGYNSRRTSRKTEQACARLQYLLTDSALGWHSPSAGYDLKYSSEAFLLSALKVLDIDRERYRASLDVLRAQSEKMRQRYELCANIDPAGFIAAAAPRFMAAMVVYRHRWVTLPDNVALLSDQARDALVKRCIRHHYQMYGSTLPPSVTITGYCLRRIRMDGCVEEQVTFTCPV